MRGEPLKGEGVDNNNIMYKNEFNFC